MGSVPSKQKTNGVFIILPTELRFSTVFNYSFLLCKTLHYLVLMANMALSWTTYDVRRTIKISPGGTEQILFKGVCVFLE